MFDSTDSSYDAGHACGDESEPVLPPVPDDLLTDMDPVERARLDELDWLEYEAELAVLSPAERWERVHGLPAVPDSPEFLTEVSQAVAADAQDLAVQASRIRIIADAHRIAALITAYERSMVDLIARFGAKVGAGDGLGAQAFFRSFGLLTRTHPKHVSAEVKAGIALRDRLPSTWAVFQAGTASWSRARLVLAQADGLDAEHWPAFDQKAAGLVVSSTRLKGDLRKARERLQDDTAGERAKTTFERRRTSLELGADSGVALVVEGLATDWVPVNDALHRAAVAAHGTDPFGRTVAQLRHDIALDIMHEGLQQRAGAGAGVPDRKPVTVSLILTVPALAWLGRTSEPAQLAGYGPIAMELAKELAGTATSFIRVLTHPFTGARLAMDRTTYRPPVDLERWIRIRDGRSRFPGSTTPAHLADIDHAREWRYNGRTEDTNLVTLDRATHNGKTAGLYQEDYLDTGVVGWTEAWGRYFEDPPDDPLDPAPPDLLPPPPDPAGDETPF